MQHHTAIIGANGYSGRTLAQLLMQHPHAQLSAILSRNDDWHLGNELPKAQSIPHYPLSELNTVIKGIDTLFLATPAQASLELICQLADKKLNIIDLSGACRLPADIYQQWYGHPQPTSTLFQQAQYGLSPWWQRTNTTASASTTPRLIANPGCFATCAQMALLPLINSQIIQPQGIIIDAKSGLTGAGRSPKTNLLFCEMAQDFYPYKIGCHQHTPEINHHLTAFSQQTCDVTLTTHVLPIKRGISMSIYPKLTDACSTLSIAQCSQQIDAAFQQAYNDYPLIKYANLSTLPDAKHKQYLSLSHVAGTANTHISWHYNGKQLIIFSLIDNLLKGAASQAIENFNQLHNIALANTVEQMEGIL